MICHIELGTVSVLFLSGGDAAWILMGNYYLLGTHGV